MRGLGFGEHRDRVEAYLREEEEASDKRKAARIQQMNFEMSYIGIGMLLVLGIILLIAWPFMDAAQKRTEEIHTWSHRPLVEIKGKTSAEPSRWERLKDGHWERAEPPASIPSSSTSPHRLYWDGDNWVTAKQFNEKFRKVKYVGFPIEAD